LVARVLAWAAVVTLWRQLIPAQIAAAQRRRYAIARQAAEQRRAS
jgi:hypothetical protein